MFRVIVISFVCVRQSLKIEKRKNWIKLKLRYFTGALTSFPKQTRGERPIRWAIGNHKLPFECQARQLSKNG
jgi:hypothetical protein